MKKHALKWFALIGAALMAFSFASCKQDDDDDTPATYTVSISTTIEHGNVTANATTGVLAGTTVKLTATPDDGYELESFSVTDANTNAITVTGGTFTMPESNVTVSATFKAKATEQTPATEPDTPSGTTYTVTFNTNGGSEVASQSVASGKTATAPTAPTKDGYVFKDWYTSSDSGTTLSDTAFDFATAITADITLYAKWEEQTSATIAVTSITINNAPTEALFVNSTGTFTATVLPDNATDKTVTWSSSDPDYVKIDSNTGEYTIMGTKGYGSATITATAGDKTATCTITGKVTYTSLSAGTVLHVGDTFYAGKVYFDTKPAVSFLDSNGAITVIEKDGYYTFQRGSNGTTPNLTAYKVKDNTDGIYIVSGSGSSTSDKFVLAVHTVQ